MGGQVRKLSTLLLMLCAVFFFVLGTAKAEPVGLNNEYTLSGGAAAGATSITLNDVTNLVAGDGLLIEPENQANTEKVEITAINTGTRTVTLKTGLQKAHAANVKVLRTNIAGSKYDHNTDPASTVATDPVTGQAITSGPHGKFTSNTNACGRCHQLHRAKTQNLIRFDISASVATSNPIYATCTFCHSFNGQSTYDVKNGMIWDTKDGKRYATNGGGFEKMVAVEGDPSVATLVKVTAKHRVNEVATKNADGSYKYVRFNAPGGYVETVAGGGEDGHIDLKCSSCHQPHGTVNGRQLVEKITTKDPTGNPVTVNINGLDKVNINVVNPFADERTEYNANITKFCSACHSDYNSSNAKGETGTYSKAYRHKMGMNAGDGLNDRTRNDGTFGYDSNKLILPTATLDGAGGAVVCTTCHYAHGTFAVVEGIKTYDDLMLNSTTALNTNGGTESAKNLRLDNRGVCQNCHNRTPDKKLPALENVLDPDQTGDLKYGEAGSFKNQKYLSPDDRTLVIRYDQYMLSQPGDFAAGTSPAYDVENPANYSLAQGAVTNTPVSVKLQPDNRTVVLTFAAGAIPVGSPPGSNSFTLTINNVMDLNGNTIQANTQLSFTK
ncbi:cytochrome c3 family protein [Effusibacillus lacus]|uniref:Uncharacterized protein n=1 Tax=Effusibacillus lacus TaxID=1348429 RepID=A0A292YJS9_9BACL|nr:cytochrome c3 family protein [Effusibacillus lacus]TCS76123.1 putative CXXCH cytochrome family protein [Effusibacillus lacus]GAX91367.1 hypothetical protein EFBL_3036 [Effusibacillus lacus]